MEDEVEVVEMNTATTKSFNASSHAGSTTGSSVRLTRRGKRVVRSAVGLSLLVVIGAGFSAVSSAAAVSHHSSTPSTSGYVRVTVAPGETLWSLAALVGGDKDLSVVVDQIVEANALTSSDLTVGDRLWIPARSK